MLIRRQHLEGIRNGEISLAFRRWKRPTVKAGGRLRTAIGVLSIETVTAVTEAKIRATDARKAGYESRGELLEALSGRTEQIYRIQLSFAGEDERIKLRKNSKLSAKALAEILEQLDRYDQHSRRGPWTAQFLRLIHKQPSVRAEELAAEFGVEKPWFKRNVRKLKEIGLTESLSPGYRLSPRGEAVLEKLPKRR